MHCYRELVQPTVVTHGVACRLAGQSNLVLIRGGSLCQIFEVQSRQHHPENPPRDTPSQPPQVGTQPNLKFISEFPLNGTVTGIATLERENSPNHALVVSFKQAKVVVMEWSPLNRRLVPLSLHYYEKELDQQHFYEPNYNCKLIVEPQGLALSYLYQNSRLAIVSFASDSMETEESAFLPSVLLSPFQLDASCTNIVALEYLKGYNEPTYAVISQPQPTWTGLLPLRKDTCTFMALSVNAERRCSTPFITVADLPYDLEQIVVLDTPIRGCLLVGGNHLIYIDTRGRTVAMATNKYAEKASNLACIDCSHLSIVLEQSKLVQIPNTKKVLLVLKSGDAHLIGFKVDGVKVFGFAVSETLAFSCPRPSVLLATDKYVFMASQTSDAQLLSWQAEHNNLLLNGSIAEVQDIDELYQHINSVPESQVQFALCDTLRVVGPVTSMANVDGALVTSCGSENTSALCIFKRSVSFRITLQRRLPMPSKIWALGSHLVYNVQNQSAFCTWPDLKAYKTHSGFVREFRTLDIVVRGDLYYHVHANGIVVYNTEFERVQELLFKTQATTAKIVGEYVLAFASELLLVKLDPQPQEPVALLGQECGPFTHNESMVAAENNGLVLIFELESPENPTKYNFNQLDSVVDPVQEIDPALLENSEITDLYFVKLGQDPEPTSYLVVVVEDQMCVYEQINRSFVKVYTVPQLIDKPAAPVKLGAHNTLVLLNEEPFILMKALDSPIRCHPLDAPHTISIVEYGQGIMLADDDARLSQADLYQGFDYTSCLWPHKLIKMNKTIVAMAYNSVKDALCVGHNTPVPYKPKDPHKDEQSQEEEPDESEMPPSHVYTGSLSLVSPETWEVISECSLAEGETLLCVCSVSFEVGRSTGFYEEYFCAGTTLLRDESTFANGYIHCYAVTSESVPGKNVPQEYTLKLKHTDWVRGAVSSMCGVMGKLAVAQGQQIIVRGMQEDRSIEPIAFLETGPHISSLKAIRNLLVAGDLYKGTLLVNLCLEPYRLDVIAKDFGSGVTTLEYISSELKQDLYIAIAKHEHTLSILQMNPDNPQSQGGTRLIVSSEIYTGKQLNCSLLCYGEGEDVMPIAGASDGSLVSVMPMYEIDYKALYVLTQQMMDREQPVACLNPRMFRQMNCSISSSSQPVIDFGLAEQFWNLDTTRQEAYSKRLGRSGIEQVFDALQRQVFEF